MWSFQMHKFTRRMPLHSRSSSRKCRYHIWCIEIHGEAGWNYLINQDPTVLENCVAHYPLSDPDTNCTAYDDPTLKSWLPDEYAPNAKCACEAILPNNNYNHQDCKHNYHLLSANHLCSVI